MPILRMVSFLGGRLFSTSLFRRRSRKGRSTCGGWWQHGRAGSGGQAARQEGAQHLQAVWGARRARAGGRQGGEVGRAAGRGRSRPCMHAAASWPPSCAHRTAAAYPTEARLVQLLHHLGLALLGRAHLEPLVKLLGCGHQGGGGGRAGAGGRRRERVRGRGRRQPQRQAQARARAQQLRSGSSCRRRGRRTGGEDLWQQEVEQRPQLVQVVLRAGDGGGRWRGGGVSGRAKQGRAAALAARGGRPGSDGSSGLARHWAG